MAGSGRRAAVPDLWVISSYFNPSRYRTKRDNYERFAAGLRRQRVPFLVVENAFADEPFELPASAEVLQVRGGDVMWQKERLLNLAIAQLPATCTKVAWLDGDILFEDPAWAARTSAALDRDIVVQPFATALRLPQGATRPVDGAEVHDSFLAIYARDPLEFMRARFDRHGHTGYGWAMRRDALVACGLYDAGIAGNGDHLMAHAFLGDWAGPCITRMLPNAAHLRWFQAWSRRAFDGVRARVGVVPGRILHLWHGETRHRRYHDRSQELASFGFDPARDIRISARGCWEWASDKPDLHRWSRRYFDVRHEDGAQEIAAPVPAPVVIAPPPVAVAVPAFQDPLYVTFLVGRSHAGGVARVVREAAVALTRRRATMKVIVLDDAQPAERLDGLDRVHTVRIDPRHARPLHAAALEALATPSRAVLACEVAGELAPLRTFGAQVVPVVLDGAHAPALDRRRDPLAIALSDGARRRLDEQRAGVPIVTLRPEIASPRRPEDLAKDRAELRHRYGIPASAIVVGMIGEFDATRGYTRAVRAFAALRARADARLMIVGGWQGELGRAAHAAATRLALDLGVLPDLVLVGDAAPTAPFHAAFDVLLDASLDGAAGLDALDAAAAACPVIAATTAASTTVDVADPEAVAAAILDESQPAVRRVAAAPSDPDLFARVLALLAHFGLPGPPRAGTRALIIADTLGADAPARALRDLLLHLPDPAQIVLGLLSPGAADTAAIARAGVTIASVHTGTSMLDKIERLLVLAERSGCQTIAFWQVPARIKLTIAKILEASPVRLVDVARGPAFGRELADAAPFARRLSLTAEEYLARLDMIVARDPTVEVAGARRAVVIPDGVARAAAIAPVRLVDGADAPLDPRCAIGTCVRLAPGRRIERLIAALALVARTHPRVSLTILGSAQPGQADYAAALADAARDSAGRVRFVGAVDAPAAYLAAFRIFARPSHEDDAPSLVEVMATGVPIVELGPRRAADPIVHGRTGFFVGDEPAAIAAALVRLLDDGGLRRRIGAAARRRAQRDFGIERMVDGYLRALALPRARRRAR